MERSIGEISATDEIVFAPKQKKIQVTVFNKNIISDLSEDFVLPDYNPEIRKLLRITPYTPIPSCYVNMSDAEFAGNINWSVLYVTNEGKLASAMLSSPFDVTAEYNSDEADPDGDFSAYDDIRTENIVGRVTAPRKINIKCRLIHYLKVLGEKTCETELFGNTDTPESIKSLVHTIPACYIKRAYDDSIELTETLPVSENEKIVFCRSNVSIVDTEITSDGIACRGVVNLKCLVSKEGTAPSPAERKIPFSITVPTEFDSDGWNTTAHGKISEISFEESESDTVCRMRLSISAEAQKTELVEYTADIFSTKNTCECSSTVLHVPSIIFSGKSNFSHDGSSDANGIPDESEIIDAIASPVAETVSFENNRYIIFGKIKYNVLYRSEEGEYFVRETEFPFSFDLSEGKYAPKDFFADICVISTKVRKEGENIAFSSDMTVNATVIIETSVNAISEADFSDEIERENASAFTVVYPSSDETLWSIAKRYLTDPSALAFSNGIASENFDSADSLVETKYLII